MGGPVPPASGRPRSRRTSPPVTTGSVAAPVGPVRTCLGCRKKADRADLVRLVREGDHVVVDVARSAPGRGGWLHPQRACLDAALRRGGIGRALRMQGPADTSAVSEYFAAVETRA